MVTITYGHGYLTDGNGDPTDWVETEDGLTAELTVASGYVWKINATVAAGNKTVKYVYDMTNISATTYTRFLARYQTSSATIKAKIVLDGTVADQTVLAETANTTWTIVDVAVDASIGNIDKIELWATSDTGQVYYDFALIYKGIFTIPNTWGGMTWKPQPRRAQLEIPGRIGDITQHLGAHNTVVTLPNLDLDLTQSTLISWKRPQTSTTKTDTNDGEVFQEMVHRQNAPNTPQGETEPWQWLNLDTVVGTTTVYSGKFKAVVDPVFRWVKNGDGSTSRLLDLTFTEYRQGSGSHEPYTSRWGIS